MGDSSRRVGDLFFCYLYAKIDRQMYSRVSKRSRSKIPVAGTIATYHYKEGKKWCWEVSFVFSSFFWFVLGVGLHHTVKSWELESRTSKDKNKDSVSRERHVISAIPDSQGQERICLLFLVIYWCFFGRDSATKESVHRTCTDVQCTAVFGIHVRMYYA